MNPPERLDTLRQQLMAFRRVCWTHHQEDSCDILLALIDAQVQVINDIEHCHTVRLHQEMHEGVMPSRFSSLPRWREELLVSLEAAVRSLVGEKGL